MPTLSLLVQINNSDNETLDRTTRQLRSELLDLDIQNVRLAEGNTPPPEAKGDASSVGSLVVDLANSAGLAALFQLIGTWVTRSQGRSITVQEGNRRMTIDRATVEQSQQIIDYFTSEKYSNSENDEAQ